MLQRGKIGYLSRFAPPLAAAAALAGLLAFPDLCRSAAGKAAEACLTVLLPSLFPYFVLSNLFIGMGWTRIPERALASVMRRLFALPGACAGPVLLGLIGGYPIGAKSAAALYESGQCTRAQSARLISFCNNSGPAFLFGAVGAGIFGDMRAGLALYLAHVLAAFAVGILSRLFARKDSSAAAQPSAPKRPQPRFSAVFPASAVQALASVGTISAFVLLFAVLRALLSACGLLPLLTNLACAALSPFSPEPALVGAALDGFLEMTAGLTALSVSDGSLTAQLCTAAWICGWGGLSVHCQTLALVQDAGLSLRPYLLGKLAHSLLCVLFLRLLLPVFL